MAACEWCWAEASRRAARCGGVAADYYPEVLAKYPNGHGWPSDKPCGGVSVNGADPKCCEVHMLPWGHPKHQPAT